jgi:hypothetical protein
MRQTPHLQVEGYGEPRQRIVDMLGAQAARLAFEVLQFLEGGMPRVCVGYGCAAVHGLLLSRG